MDVLYVEETDRLFHDNASLPQGNLFESQRGKIRVRCSSTKWVFVTTQEDDETGRYMGKSPKIQEHNGKHFLCLSKFSETQTFPFKELIPLSEITKAEVRDGFIPPSDS